MPSTKPAPWRSHFLATIDSMPQPSFTLASLHSSDRDRDMSASPRARTCIFRGLWASLAPNPRNPAPRNPPLYESDLPVFTTDARMAKMPDLADGGPVEAVFWAAERSEQWRLRGRARVLAHDGHSSTNDAARAAIAPRMRRLDDDGAWDWQREIEAHFGNLSPGMRGSFKNPPPGTPRATRAPGPGEGLGQTVGDELLRDEVARRNFRVVVIVPEVVELVDLSDPADQRRWLYTFVGPDGSAASRTEGGELLDEWEKVELWP